MQRGGCHPVDGCQDGDGFAGGDFSIRTDLTFATSPVREGDGTVTYGEAFAVQPFGNSLVTMTLTGAQLDTVVFCLRLEVDPHLPACDLRLGGSFGAEH